MVARVKLLMSTSGSSTRATSVRYECVTTRAIYSIIIEDLAGSVVSTFHFRFLLKVRFLYILSLSLSLRVLASSHQNSSVYEHAVGFYQYIAVVLYRQYRVLPTHCLV